MEKRTMYNRNETNGEYDIWGHDIGNLVLSSIRVHKTFDETDVGVEYRILKSSSMVYSLIECTSLVKQ